MYDIESYKSASSLEEALKLLDEEPDRRIICGGSDVLIRIREGRLAGCSLLGIREIPELLGVSLAENGDLLIGPASTFSFLEKDPLILSHVPVLSEAVALVGGPQVRNTGTIGGNVCNGAVSADSVPTLFSLNARLLLKTAKESRLIPIGDFYKGPGKVDLRRGEMLTKIVIPKEDYAGMSGCYIKYAMRNAMDIATISCSAVVRLDETKKTLEEVRITFGVAAPVPLRLFECEKALAGSPIEEGLLERAAEMVRKELHPRDSWRASAAFRLQVGGEIASRALREAIRRQGGIIA